MTRTSWNIIVALVEEIARHLPGEWDLKPFPEDWGRRGGYLTELNTKAILVIGDSQEYSERNKNKLSVSTDYPKDNDGRPSSARRPKISVSAAKSGKQIAQDIERRLLPEYLPILEKELATNKSWNEYENKTTNIASQIAKLVRVKRAPKETTVSFYHSPYNIFRETMSEAKVVSDYSIELTLRLDVATTMRLLNQLLHGRFEDPDPRSLIDTSVHDE